ncbi:hypothetical protein B723_14780 [Pseudomonas fluorescens NCIMB 11764]|uniref:Uncharacterized protein n=1 Tax=Pseudomonas fluorescens NCIMB 11764 TaxID=1221522 RepID=A0A0K1QPM4_PSEFL|nr:hypothetical protein B723_14780 [Pseudomonas fluorescens NCIMB 11764]
MDSIGTPFAGGGLNTGLRDLARFGEMLRNDGRVNGQQIAPKAVVDPSAKRVIVRYASHPVAGV